MAGYLGRRTGATAATEAMEAAAAALESDDPSAGDTYATALDHWLAAGAADLEDRAPATLAELGLTVGTDALMTSLSGGQAARVALAALLLSRFDIVLLDEPTNDLDLDGLERLESFVRGLRAGVVLVSHDREFLARCVTRIVELDLAQQQVSVYDGGYDAFLEERAIARRHAREAYDEFADKKADLQSRARTQREWSSQGVRNAMKKSPDNDKIRRKAQTESSEKQAQKVRQMESRIARLDEVEEPRKEWVLQFDIAVRAAVLERRRDPRRRRRAPRRLRARPGVAAGLRGRPHRHHRPQRRGQDHAAQAAARARAAGRGTGLARRQRRDRRDRPGPYVAGRGPAARGGVRARRAGHDAVPRCARSSRSSGSGPTRWPAWSSGSRPASAPGRRWRSCRPAG